MRPSIHLLRAFVTGALILAATPPAQAQKTLNYTDESPNRGSRAEAIAWFAEQLDKRTNGQVKMKAHWGGALMKAVAATKGIGSGAADMGLIIGSYNPKLHHLYMLADLPTEYSDPWVTSRGIYKTATTNKDMRAEFEKLNLKYVTNITTGPIQLICKNKVVEKLSDLKGLKVRGISVYGQVFKDLGAVPVRVNTYEAYQGLDTGLIDCSQTYGYAIPAFKLQEVSNELTMLDWGGLGAVGVFMNLDTFKGLTPEQQKVVDELGSEFIDFFSQKLVAGNDDAYSKLKAGIDGHQLRFHQISDAEKAGLLKAGAAYTDEWREKAKALGADPDRVIADFTAALKQFDDERKAKGYPWRR
jgi:TRAP-type C4-dicarboxylate transport system substrate-binding protein